MTPLVAIVIITTLTTLLTTIGIPALNALLWTLYTRLSPSAASQLRANAVLRQEVLVLKKDLLSTSSQDQFAKWAKIRRNLDKKTAEFQKSQEAIAASRTAFQTRATGIRWFLTTGLRLALQFWFAKSAMFWLPAGAVPPAVEWVLAFPKAPRGGVSIQVWVFAVGQMVGVVLEVAMGVWRWMGERRVEKVKEGEKEKVAVAMEGRQEGKAEL